MLFVTHDFLEALRLGDRVLVMKEGKIVRLDTPKAIKENPGSDFVARLLDEDGE